MDAMITMTGWVGGDVEHRVHPNLTTASFRLGCTPRINRQGTWIDAPTTWVTVTCFRSLADHISLSLHKGDPVIVSGRLRTQVWQGKEDKLDHERIVLEASAIGHDLTRGTASFTKMVRPVADPDTMASDLGELISKVETEDGPEPTEDEGAAAAA